MYAFEKPISMLCVEDEFNVPIALIDNKDSVFHSGWQIHEDTEADAFPDSEIAPGLQCGRKQQSDSHDERT